MEESSHNEDDEQDVKFILEKPASLLPPTQTPIFNPEINNRPENMLVHVVTAKDSIPAARKHIRVVYKARAECAKPGAKSRVCKITRPHYHNIVCLRSTVPVTRAVYFKTLGKIISGKLGADVLHKKVEVKSIAHAEKKLIFDLNFNSKKFIKNIILF